MLFSELQQAHQRYLDNRIFGSLDGLRGLCIVSVIWHHAPAVITRGPLARGFLGVDMFFVLSGFLIVTLLLRERERTGTINLKKFYARRTLRIFPIYYLLLFALLFLCLVIKPGSKAAWDYYVSLPFLLTYTSNWVHIRSPNLEIMWSLATEEQFYLGWPMIEKLLRRSGVAFVLAGVVLLNQLINFGLLDGILARLYGRQPNLSIFGATYTPIALGVLLAHLLHRPRTFGPAFRLLGYRGSCAVFGGVLLALIVCWPPDISGLGRLLIQLAMMLFLGALVIREDHWARPVLEARPLAYLGMISYGMYVYHMWVLHPLRIGFEKLGWNLWNWRFFLGTLLGAALVAGLSHRFIERPLLRLKSRFATGRDVDQNERREVEQRDPVGIGDRLGLAVESPV
jgi:peptidoglycan/LPS O-acetylase OafA/YrhL